MSRQSPVQDRLSSRLFDAHGSPSFDAATDTNDSRRSSGTNSAIENMAIDDDIASPPRSNRKSPPGDFSFNPTNGQKEQPSTPKARLFFDAAVDTNGKTPVPPRRKYRPTSFSSTDSDATMGYSPSPHGSRKRTATESRDEPTSMEECSPKISPNSYLTMDGRFVQSKNPFSSPMIPDYSNTDFVGAGHDAPALPMFQHKSCSPVPEHGLPSNTTTTTTASYHKIRRLYLNEDVVAASMHKVPPRISPTEVSSFPFPTLATTKPRPTPPTPVKKRPMAVSCYHSMQVKPVSQSRFETDFDVIGELGQGTFGRVLKVLSRLDGCMYAIKSTLRPAKGVADRDRMLKEVYALAALSDQADTATFHIVRYHQAWMEDNRLFIQTELCSGTLTTPLDPPRRYKLLREMLLALQFIHRHNMVHLDIKPDNIFLKNDQYKLGDFGLVSAMNDSDIEEGDCRFMSLELLRGDHSDLTKADMFSLGLTSYATVVGDLPADGPGWQALRQGNFAPPQDDPALHGILSRLLHPNAPDRPSALALLEHPLLLSDDQKALAMERSKVQAALRGMRKPLTRANTWSGFSQR